MFLCQSAVKKVVTDTHTRRVGALFFGINSISAQLRTLFSGPFLALDGRVRFSKHINFVGEASEGKSRSFQDFGSVPLI